jgi:hypothetical protein
MQFFEKPVNDDGNPARELLRYALVQKRSGSRTAGAKQVLKNLGSRCAVENAGYIRTVRGLLGGNGRITTRYYGGGVLGPGFLMACGPPLSRFTKDKKFFRALLRAVLDSSPPSRGRIFWDFRARDLFFWKNPSSGLSFPKKTIFRIPEIRENTVLEFLKN